MLYDRAPGGAGFVAEAFTRLSEVEAAARKVCDCPARCERTCYDCLKDYGNQAYHEVLNRKDALVFLTLGPSDQGLIQIVPTP